MYGMVNQAVRGLVLEKFGPDKWKDIHTNAASPQDFNSFEQYDDAVTYDLVGAAVEVLGLPAEQILFAFGDYWVKTIAATNYADLMSKTGTDFVGFVKNLDHMHSRIQVTFPGYSPPSFRVNIIDDSRFQLDYYSHREGLLPFVAGLMTALAEHFDSGVEIQHIPDDQHPMPCKRMEIAHGPLQAG
jgi:hypothetical protein